VWFRPGPVTYDGVAGPPGGFAAAGPGVSHLKRKPPKKRAAEVVGFLGVGLDGDGHARLTEIEHFLLVGGSHETHEQMQETAVKFGEALEKRGKRLRDTTPEEAAEILREARG
jgi:hypothetical protein